MKKIMMDYNNPNDFWRHNDYDPYNGMDDEERMTAGCLQGMLYIVALAVAALICSLFASCKSVEYVPVIEHHTDTVRINHTERDSIYIHDSTYVREKGDTMLIEKWHTRWRDRVVHDTTYISKTDSVPKPYPVTQYVEKPLSTPQKGLMVLGGVLIFLGIYRFARWLKGVLP